ncbi:MAG: hypothetical protein NZT61_05345 [Deltaproteobacteria bacterium]|nr:hypothetical protein [Deltaproteobacteria bacterium]
MEPLEIVLSHGQFDPLTFRRRVLNYDQLINGFRRLSERGEVSRELVAGKITEIKNLLEEIFVDLNNLQVFLNHPGEVTGMIIYEELDPILSSAITNSESLLQKLEEYLNAQNKGLQLEESSHLFPDHDSIISELDKHSGRLLVIEGRLIRDETARLGLAQLPRDKIFDLRVTDPKAFQEFLQATLSQREYSLNDLLLMAFGNKLSDPACDKLRQELEDDLSRDILLMVACSNLTPVGHYQLWNEAFSHLMDKHSLNDPDVVVSKISALASILDQSNQDNTKQGPNQRRLSRKERYNMKVIQVYFEKFEDEIERDINKLMVALDSSRRACIRQRVSSDPSLSWITTILFKDDKQENLPRTEGGQTYSLTATVRINDQIVLIPFPATDIPAEHPVGTILDLYQKGEISDEKFENYRTAVIEINRTLGTSYIPEVFKPDEIEYLEQLRNASLSELPPKRRQELETELCTYLGLRDKKHIEQLESKKTVGYSRRKIARNNQSVGFVSQPVPRDETLVKLIQAALSKTPTYYRNNIKQNRNTILENNRPFETENRDESVNLGSNPLANYLTRIYVSSKVVETRLRMWQQPMREALKEWHHWFNDYFFPFIEASGGGQISEDLMRDINFIRSVYYQCELQREVPADSGKSLPSGHKSKPTWLQIVYLLKILHFIPEKIVAELSIRGVSLLELRGLTHVIIPPQETLALPES